MSENQKETPMPFIELVAVLLILAFMVIWGIHAFQEGQDGEDEMQLVNLYHKVFYDKDPVVQTDGAVSYQLNQGKVDISWRNTSSGDRVLTIQGLRNPEICVSALEAIVLQGVTNVKRHLERPFQIKLATNDRLKASLDMNTMTLVTWDTITRLCKTVKQSGKLSISRSMKGIEPDSF